jgi:hypothetical protein
MTIFKISTIWFNGTICKYSLHLRWKGHHISHADASIAEEQGITCKNKSNRNLGLSFLTENLQNIDCLVINGCASSEKSIHDIVHPKFPNASIAWDLWHFEKNGKEVQTIDF